MTRTLIIGAGIVGACLAHEAARAGDDVTLVTAHPPGGLASAASFGWINASFSLSEAHFHLRAAAMAAHRALRAFPAGRPAKPPGCLWFEAQGEAQDNLHRDLLALGYRVEPLSRAAIAARLPALGHPPEAALFFFPDEDAVDPAEMARALIAASGARVVQSSAEGLVEESGRITGVHTAEGTLRADRVILAAGIGAPALLAPLGLTLPMLTRPGMVVTTAPLPPICPVILATPGQEVRQDAQGRLIAPAAAGHQADTAETWAPFR